MEILGDRARALPAPPHVVWESLTNPERPGARPWLLLADDEVHPTVIRSEFPRHVTWTSIWPARPNDVIEFEVTPKDAGSLLRFTLKTPDGVPVAAELSHLRYRLNRLLFGDLQASYGQ